ncbi:MAG TPA: hypothetical protein VK045_10285 [Ornithinicoccus sp.]|nr:hypothetical protein [Ornithinicoccus sp.]
MRSTRTTWGRGIAAVSVAALLLSGCGSEDPGDTTTPAGASDGQTSESAPPQETTSSPEGGSEVLTADAIAGVALPADPDALIEALGSPTDDSEMPGCLDVAGGGVTRALQWDDFGAYGTAATADEILITSWEVTGPTLPDGLTIPDGLTVGSSTEEAQAALPDADLVEGAPHGGPLLTDGGLGVKLDGTTGEVTGVWAHIGEVSCD